MKIALVIYGDINQRSGGYAYDRKLVDYFISRGASVEILSLPQSSYGPSLFLNGNKHVQNLLLSWDGDLMIQDELVHPSLFLLNSKLKKKGIKIVGLVHHLRQREDHPGIFKTLIYTPVERLYLKSLQGFVFNSRTSQKDVETLLSCSCPGPIATPGFELPQNLLSRESVPGISPTSSPDFIKSPRTLGILKILFVGSLIPRKNLLVLLKALADWMYPHWSLTVVGEGPDNAYNRRCRKLAKKLGDKVSFLGYLAPAELHEVYGTHHILTLPSDYEGFGMVYLEAMAQRCIPLGGKWGGAAEVIGDAGVLVAPGDKGEILAALDFLTTYPDWEKQQEKARLRALSFDTWDRSFSKVWDYLQVTLHAGF